MASRKGQKDCCCDGCEGKPTGNVFYTWQDHPSGGSIGVPVELSQSYCCACVPKSICVSVECHGGTNASASTTFPLKCESYRPGVIYEGTIAVAGHQVDLAFAFRISNGKCYFCLSSTALAVTGSVPGDCFLIDAAARAEPDDFCRTLFRSGEPIKWNVPWSACGSYLTVTASADSLTAISGRRPCLDPYGNLIPDDNPIKNLCTGCGCVCTCACIIVRYPHAGYAEQLPACIDGTTWSTGGPYGFAVSLVENYETGACELALTSTGSIVLGAPAPNVAISVNDPEHPCPHPQGSWSLMDNAGHPVFVEFNCQDCQGCSQIPVTGCCEAMIPRLLHATVTTSGTGHDFFGNPVTCSCNFSLGLVYDEIMEAWIGSADKAFCNHGVTLTLVCNATGTFTLIFDHASPCLDASNTVSSQCSPLSLSFAFNTSGIGCCGINWVTGTATVQVVVTE